MLKRNTKIPVVHPGVVLKEEILRPREISVQAAALKLNISRKQLSLFTNGKASVSVELAKKLEIGTGVSAEFWLNRQNSYNLYQAANQKVEAEPLFRIA